MASADQPVTILVVDDDPGLARLIEIALRREGFATGVALSGEEAIAWMADRHADLVLLDLKLPDYHGKDLIERLDSLHDHVPFIIITGQGDERVAVEMMRRGALDYLVKDVNFLEFVPTVVRRALAQLDKEARLAAAEDDRKRLEREILEISEREQERIGRDLHDDLGQQLAALSIMTTLLLRSLSSRSAPETAAVSNISDLLKKTVAMTRSLARGLHPVAQEPGGLMSALHDLAARVSDLFRLDCQFECAAPVFVDDITTATHLYRIAQEAVTNGVKHGRAKHVGIRLSSDVETLVLTVKNDGACLAPLDPKRHGMGLRIMHYRADTIGARVSIEKLESGGTCVTCILPVTRRPSPAAREAAHGKKTASKAGAGPHGFRRRGQRRPGAGGH